jgi:hypothetical protein
MRGSGSECTFERLFEVLELVLELFLELLHVGEIKLEGGGEWRGGDVGKEVVGGVVTIPR